MPQKLKVNTIYRLYVHFIFIFFKTVLYLPSTTIAKDTLDMSQKTERFEMRVAPEFGVAIDDWRRQQERIPSRAEAIRLLVGSGLILDGMADFAGDLSGLVRGIYEDNRLTKKEIEVFNRAMKRYIDVESNREALIGEGDALLPEVTLFPEN